MMERRPLPDDRRAFALSLRVSVLPKIIPAATVVFGFVVVARVVWSR